jgi:hypothetical protein
MWTASKSLAFSFFRKSFMMMTSTEKFWKLSRRKLRIFKNAEWKQCLKKT